MAKKIITIRLDPEMLAVLQSVADNKDRPLSWVIRDLLRRALDRQKSA